MTKDEYVKPCSTQQKLASISKADLQRQVDVLREAVQRADDYLNSRGIVFHRSQEISRYLRKALADTKEVL